MSAKHNVVFAALFVALALCGAPRSAAADDDASSTKISTRVTPKGEVIVQVQVATKIDGVRAVLASAERSHNLAPTTVSAHATRDGACERVKLQVRGIITPFQLETRRCPTARGYLETLVGSSDFVDYRNEWELKDLGEVGTLVTFKTRTRPNVQVPESLLLMETKRVLTRLFKNLLGALGEG